MNFLSLDDVARRLLDVMNLEEVLEDNDLEAADVLLLLLKAGKIRVPDWLEAPDYEEEED
jgi:hypothetical protein